MKLKQLADFIPKEGDLIEIGVFRGNGSMKILETFKGRKLIAVDSFEGMAEPTEHDFIDGKTRYPKGRLAFGFNDYIKILDDKGYELDKDFYPYKGFVPDVLKSVIEKKFAFAYIDLDQYQPTLDAWEWLRERLVSKAVVIFDDYIDEGYLARRAVDEILEKDFDMIYYKEVNRLIGNNTQFLIRVR